MTRMMGDADHAIRAGDAANDASAVRFFRWFTEDAAPLWLNAGVDKAGGFFEALDFDAAPLTGRPRRARVQSRQIYTFTMAALRGWAPQAEPIAAAGFEFFLEKACPDGPEKGCVHLLDDRGASLNDLRDLYDQAFFLLACSARLRAGDDGADAVARNIVNFLDTELAAPSGGWLENDRSDTPRRQNPHMHLFEAFTALHDATGDEYYLKYADRIFDLFATRFMDDDHDVLREYFDASLTDADEKAPIEPGHMFEWAALLQRYERATRRDQTERQRRLTSRAAEIGADASFHGFVGNGVGLDGAGANSNKRLWPQTEYIKACSVLARKGEPAAARRAATLIDGLFETYLATKTPGLWYDEFNGAGAPVAKDVPASILYHLFEAVDAIRPDRSAP